MSNQSANSSRAVVLVADRAYFVGVLAVLCSLARNAQLDASSARVILLRPGALELDDRDSVLIELATNLGVNLKLQPIPRHNSRLPARWRAASAFWKLDIPRLCPRVTRAVYLDSDVVVLSSLAALFELSLEGRALAAAVDLPAHPTIGSVLGDWAAAESCASEPYFNSGVMVMDLDAWRKEELSERAYEFTFRYPQYVRFIEQNSLNAAVKGRFHILDPRWNVEPDFSMTLRRQRQTPGWRSKAKQFAKWEREARILHFMGSTKPWQEGWRGRRSTTELFRSYLPAGAMRSVR